MRPALQQLLFLLVYRLLLPRFFTTNCLFSVRRRSNSAEPALLLPQGSNMVAVLAGDSTDTVSSEVSPETVAKIESGGLPLYSVQVHSLRSRSQSFEALRFSSDD